MRRNPIHLCLALVFSLVLLAVAATPAVAQQDMEAARPFDAVDTVWLEDMTWMEIRDAVRSGKTTVILPFGSIEFSGPYTVVGKHNPILRSTVESVARALGTALIAPIVKFESTANPDDLAYGAVVLRPATYKAVATDMAISLQQHGFEHIVLLGDSGGNQQGLREVALALDSRWAQESTTIHFIPEYYGSWQAVDEEVGNMGLDAAPDPDTTDDYSMTAMLIALDSEATRFERRVAAGLATVSGNNLLPVEQTIASARKFIDMRVRATAGGD